MPAPAEAEAEEKGTMCTNNNDFQPDAMPNDDANCAAFNSLMLTTMNTARGTLEENWGNLDCSVDLAATREEETMRTYLDRFGGICCGGAEKARCYVNGSSNENCGTAGDYSYAFSPNFGRINPTVAHALCQIALPPPDRGVSAM